MPTHFKGPILSSGFPNEGRGWFRDLHIGFDPDFIVLFDDFVMVDDDQTNDWTVVKDSSATVGIVADAVGGQILLSSAATTDDDGSSIQGNEIFLPAAGKKIWFEAKVKIATAAQVDAFVGLTQNFATDPEAVLTASNRIGFQINDGNASILCKTEATNTETSTDSGSDAADATFVTLGILVEGTGKVEFYVNRSKVATHTTNIPTTELAVGLMELSGQATGTQTMAVDYVFCAADR